MAPSRKIAQNRITRTGAALDRQRKRPRTTAVQNQPAEGIKQTRRCCEKDASPRSLHDLGHTAPGVVVVVAYQPALPLHADELEQAPGRPCVLGGDHVRRSQDIQRSALYDSKRSTGTIRHIGEIFSCHMSCGIYRQDTCTLGKLSAFSATHGRGSFRVTYRVGSTDRTHAHPES